MRRRAHRAAAIAAACALLLTACRGRATGPAPERHELSGRVVAVDAPAGRVTVRHREIPGFMDAMTMELRAEPPSAIASLVPGDEIRAILVVDGAQSWIENVQRLDGAATGFEVDDAQDPQIGASVPELELVDQAGNGFSWKRFGGSAVLVTFIYTRCPLPDYCARMTANFEAIAKHPEVQRNERVALLCITIDPEYDTPQVLSEYAKAHVASDIAPSRWTFATGSQEEVRRVAKFFGLSFEATSGQITHSLRTVLVGPDGRVAKIYRGNTWLPDEAAADLVAAAGPTAETRKPETKRRQD